MKLSSENAATGYLSSTYPNSRSGHSSRILMSIPTGFQVRQFVHSGVLKMLIKKGFEILIVSPNRSGEGFAAELPNGVEVFAFDFAHGPLIRRYLAARQHLLVNGPATVTLREKMTGLWRRLPSAALLAQVGTPLLNFFPGLRTQALCWERLILRHKALDMLLSTKSIDALVLGTPGYFAQDAILMHAAVSRGIPVVAAVMSWDNLSSKGLINPVPDRLLVWSEYMQCEAMDLQGIPRHRIVETGSPVHDAFANSDRFGSRADNLRQLGLDPERRLIFYGTNHGGFFPNEFEVVQRVAQWVEQDALGTPCQLLVRLHPQAVAGPFAVATDPYRTLASERVKVEFPPVRDSSLLWDLPKNDLEHLVRLLRDADVVINTGSTLAIDAAILDRPVVCIAYDPAGVLPIDSYYKFTHMANVIRAGAARLATSPEDLRQKIAAYLNHPNLDREGRRRIVEQQFGRVDGCSAERTAEAIVNTIQSKSKHGCTPTSLSG